MRKYPFGFSPGFSLLEMLVTMTLIAALASLVVPCWGMLTKSRSKQAATSIVMESLERARHAAITKKTDVWVIFQHQGGLQKDALRLLSRQGGIITTLDSWQPLPTGISFFAGSDSLMKERPPAEILITALNGETIVNGKLFGALMFQRSGRVGIPMQGGVPLILELNSVSSMSPTSILISRATGRATTK